ncbi:MAG: DUF2892 domain-containing protein [Deltaproteobacteria bacterium]|nr:DUF2892 domain-containing protein [Deltaproteobacteria bacterium]
MACNISKTNMTVRIILGVILIALFFVFYGVIGIISLIIGVIALVTGIIRYCPLYGVLKINTCKPKE